jgi:hypothetical protein
MDDQPLEGGGRGGGGGGGYAAPIGGAVGAAGVLGTTKVMLDKAEKDRAARDAAESAKERLTQKEKQMVQEADDAKMQTKKDKAYNAAKTYPENFSKGGTASARGDGIAQRGKTKGTFVMCGGGMARGKR